MTGEERLRLVIERRRVVEGWIKAVRYLMGLWFVLGIGGLVLSYLHLLDAARAGRVTDWTAYALAALPDLFVVAAAATALLLSAMGRPHRWALAVAVVALALTLGGNLAVSPDREPLTLAAYVLPAAAAAAGLAGAEVMLRLLASLRSELASLRAEEAALRAELTAASDPNQGPRARSARRRPQSDPERAQPPAEPSEPARAPEPARAQDPPEPPRAALRAVPESVSSHCARPGCETCADIRRAVAEGCALSERALAAHLNRGGTALRTHLRAVRIENTTRKGETA